MFIIIIFATLSKFFFYFFNNFPLRLIKSSFIIFFFLVSIDLPQIGRHQPFHIELLMNYLNNLLLNIFQTMKFNRKHIIIIRNIGISVSFFSDLKILKSHDCSKHRFSSCLIQFKLSKGVWLSCQISLKEENNLDISSRNSEFD